MIDYMIYPKIFVSVFTFLCGCCIGSFLNVLIYRIPIGMDFKKGRSMCFSCKHQLHAIDLVPLFSWIFLGGKCRYCKAKISAQYPIVEALTGILFTAAYWLGTGCKINLAFFGYCIAISALIVTTVIDFRTMEIPDSMWITVFIGSFFVYGQELIDDGGFDLDCFLARFIGIFAASGVLFILALITKGGMGGGDIKLMAACGFLLGWKQVILALIMGAAIGTLYLVFTAIKNKGKVPRKVPFAPHLSIAVVICIFAGERILQWYFDLCGITPHVHDHDHEAVIMMLNTLANLIK